MSMNVDLHNEQFRRSIALTNVSLHFKLVFNDLQLQRSFTLEHGGQGPEQETESSPDTHQNMD